MYNVMTPTLPLNLTKRNPLTNSEANNSEAKNNMRKSKFECNVHSVIIFILTNYERVSSGLFLVRNSSDNKMNKTRNKINLKDSV